MNRIKPDNPFRYFNSSPEVIRLAVMMYVRFPLSLRNVEDLLFERGSTSATRWCATGGTALARCLRATFVPRCTEWMRAELGGPTWRVWVAIQHDRIVGNVWLGAIPKIPNPGAEREEHAYVSNVYVTPSARGGVGRALLDAALADASTRADRVILWPSALSKTLYARYGFEAHGDVMELKRR